MENFIYEKDYGEEAGKVSVDDLFFEALLSKAGKKNYFSYCRAISKLVPKTINPQGQASYQRILRQCDTLAKRLSGKIRAVIDYAEADASVRLTVPYLEFYYEDEIVILQDIAQNVENLSFAATNDGHVRMDLSFHYFDPVPPDPTDPDALITLCKSAAEQSGFHPDLFDPENLEVLKKLLQQFNSTEES